jgi:hypothetical protein
MPLAILCVPLLFKTSLGFVVQHFLSLLFVDIWPSLCFALLFKLVLPSFYFFSVGMGELKVFSVSIPILGKFFFWGKFHLLSKCFSFKFQIVSYL